MKKLLILSLFSLAAFAADAPKPTPTPVNPITDKQAKDAAIVQRDFMVAKSDLDAAQTKFNAAQKALMAKYDELGASCKTIKQTFEPNAIGCVPAPETAAVTAKTEPKK
jgi:cytochrome c556